MALLEVDGLLYEGIGRLWTGFLGFPRICLKKWAGTLKCDDDELEDFV